MEDELSKTMFSNGSIGENGGAEGRWGSKIRLFGVGTDAT